MSRIGTALVDWTNYIIDVNRINILNEGSIKYAISELLEVIKSDQNVNSKNRAPMYGNMPSILDYKFEFTHPIFSDRSIDLQIKGSSFEDNYSFMEFKFVTKESTQSDKLQFYANDIFRLYALAKDTDQPVSTYFLALGEMDIYKEVFGIENRKQNPKMKISKKNFEPDNTNRPSTKFFNSFLPQDFDKPLSIDLSGSDYIKGFLSKFNEDYTYRDETKKIENTDTVKIDLEFSNLSSMDYRSNKTMAVQIWHIYN